MGYHPFSVSSDMMVSNMITFSQYALNYIGFMPDTSQKTLLEHDMGGFLASSIFLGICVSKKQRSTAPYWNTFWQEHDLFILNSWSERMDPLVFFWILINF